MIIKKKEVILYICEICNTSYENKEVALKCEQKPITHEKGVKVGDIVKITYGEGKGGLAKVIKTYICNRFEGHYASEKYWHTVALNVDSMNNLGTRCLYYDWYELVK